MIVTTTIQSISTTATNATMKVTTQFYGVQNTGSGGGGSVDSVNNVLPDVNKNITLTADEIPETLNRFWLTTILKSAYDGAVSGLAALLLTGQRLITNTEISKLSNTSGTNTGDVTVSDTDTVDLTLTGQALSADVITQMSITSDASGVKLSGDAATPGNSKYYGTDGAGAKGFHTLPSGGGGNITSKFITTGDETNSGVTMITMTGFQIVLTPGKYRIDYVVAISKDAAQGMRFDFSYSGTAATANHTNVGSQATTSTIAINTRDIGTETPLNLMSFIVSQHRLFLTVYIQATTGGNLNLLWRNTAAGNSTIHQIGSSALIIKE